MIAKERNPQIQALRALAALLVLIYHAKWLDGGYIGVDIFYVISGFLITGILVRELDSKNTISLVAFYARRTKRLLPASFLVIFATGVAGFIFLPASMRESFGKDLIAASTYVSNFLFALWENDYQNLNSTPSPFIHFWSLAVEEQFYLFWPFFILILFRIGKRRAVLYGVIATLVLSFLFSLHLTERAPIWAFYILPTRAWELAAGALLVFLPELKRARPLLALIALIALGAGDNALPRYRSTSSSDRNSSITRQSKSMAPIHRRDCQIANDTMAGRNFVSSLSMALAGACHSRDLYRARARHTTNHPLTRPDCDLGRIDSPIC